MDYNLKTLLLFIVMFIITFSCFSQNKIEEIRKDTLFLLDNNKIVTYAEIRNKKDSVRFLGGAQNPRLAVLHFGEKYRKTMYLYQTITNEKKEEE